MIDPSALKAFARDCYVAMQVPEASAELIADSLVQADLWGHPSHGVLRVFWYAKRILSGATNVDTQPDVVSDAGALIVMDGQNGIGQVCAANATDLAIERAKAHGIGAVAIRNSGHFGTAMYFTRRAAAAGCIGFLSTNASPAMAPWGGIEKRVGTNPWSWAAPAGRHAPMMLDIATTAVARGKLYAAASQGKRIPLGWAIDEEGNATTDPEAGIAGTILPMAGHKGYGVGAMMDVISGVLSGSAFGTGVTGPYVPEGHSGAGHLAIAIDIEKVRPLVEFEADMETLIHELKSTPRAADVPEIYYPGELEARAETQNKVGIKLPQAVIDDLSKEGARLGVKFPG